MYIIRDMEKVKMTLRHLQIFKAVCDTGSITRGAERLGMTQPSVSIAVRELEAFYNTKLFDRINRKIYLTDAGKTLRDYVENILSEYDEASSILRSGKSFTKCRIGVNMSFAETDLCRLVKEIKEKLPECDVNITVQNNEQLDKMLTDNQVDMLIYDGMSSVGSRYSKLLFSEKMLLVCSESFYEKESITMKELSEMPLLMREKGSGVRKCVDRAFILNGLSEKIFAESGSSLSLLELASESLGFLFVPERVFRQYSNTFSLKNVEITDENITRSYHLTYNEKKYMTSAFARLTELISQFYRG